MTLPVLPGFHPDPSVCRVGEDYYLANSSFEYLPGVPISTSRDLLHWRRIGHALDRPGQLPPPAGTGSSGIYAPTLRHHGGRFWMITTDVARFDAGHLIVWAEDPAGPWSDPVFTTGAVGIDPDLTWTDDGTCYLTWCGEGIQQARVDPSTGALRSAPERLWSGTGLAHPEGPHLYRRGGYWYLVLAEGGTERGHTVAVARSRDISGPFEPHPANPVLTHRSTTHPVQNTGHADLVELPDGSWAMVYLGVRPRGGTPMFHVNGRETFLAGIRWDGDWPFVEESRFDVPVVPTAFDDDFAVLDPRWIALGDHPSAFTSVGDGLTLAPGEGFLGVRAADPWWQASASVTSPAARLALRLDARHHVSVALSDGTLTASATVGQLTQTLAAAPAPSPVTLAIRTVPPPDGLGPLAPPDLIELGHVGADGFVALASFDGRYLSTEVAGGFTGRVIGFDRLPVPTTVRRFTYGAH
ncbi:family 43 glycosylhydrolase [Dactylosporangium sp. NPDC005572]|uniref:glycoside hydrolase family 43 protein n=1 Tax=Dactylosporangium sp. NPDC005572 TaxID=3156889 RepID=UPI0033B49DE0